ncbi:MAG: ABC transporter ATP-binding protein [Deltaproteobacteria bacterium]|nr:ABC transporter ATP-binding protein [Deltaproteobacteria bacterium]
MSSTLLEVKELRVVYDRAVLLSDISLDVGERELVGLVGPNGAGKSTLLRAISGLVLWEKHSLRGTKGVITLSGEVWFKGERIDALPAHEIVRRGLVHCPERRRPFRELTVLENLRAGGHLNANWAETRDHLERVFTLFPRLKERQGQIAGTLSGGEQQMLALGRALMCHPTLLCIDEPSLGLAPMVRAEVFQAIIAIRDAGIAILLVEQEVNKVFQISTRNYILSQSRIVAQGSGAELTADESLRASYLGM